MVILLLYRRSLLRSRYLIPSTVPKPTLGLSLYNATSTLRSLIIGLCYEYSLAVVQLCAGTSIILFYLPASIVVLICCNLYHSSDSISHGSYQAWLSALTWLCNLYIPVRSISQYNNSSYHYELNPEYQLSIVVYWSVYLSIFPYGLLIKKINVNY